MNNTEPNKQIGEVEEIPADVKDTNGIAKGNAKKNSKPTPNNLLPKILCFAAALLVWFYVYGEQSTAYENTYSVPISFESLSTLNSKGYSLINGMDSTVNVKLSGTRSKINGTTTKEITVICDLSQIHSSGEYTVPLTCNSPGGTSVISLEPSAVSIYVDKSDSKSVDVKAEIKSGGTTDLSVKIEQLVPSVESVKVTGPKEALDRISHAAVDIYLAGFIDNTVEWTGELYLVDVNGARYSNPYVKIDVTSVKVMVEVNKYKKVPIKVVYSGADAAELGYDVALSVQSVEIRGNRDIVDKIDFIETEPVDLSEVSSKTTLSVPLIPEAGVEFTDGIGKNAKVVNLTVTPISNSTKKITTKNIVVINVPNGMKATPAEASVTVELSGIRDSIAKLTPENVYAVADLVYCEGEGQYRVDLDIKYPDGIEGIKVEGDYPCDFVISY